MLCKQKRYLEIKVCACIYACEEKLKRIIQIFGSENYQNGFFLIVRRDYSIHEKENNDLRKKLSS